MTPAEIENRFAFHAADTEEKQLAHGSARGLFRSLAMQINDILPEGREKAITFTHLEESMFWANAAIARHIG